MDTAEESTVPPAPADDAEQEDEDKIDGSLRSAVSSSDVEMPDDWTARVSFSSQRPSECWRGHDWHHITVSEQSPRRSALNRNGNHGKSAER